MKIKSDLVRFGIVIAGTFAALILFAALIIVLSPP